MKEKKVTFSLIIQCGIFILLGIIAGILITNQLNKKPEPEKVKKEEKTELKEEKKELTTDEVLSSIVGEWGMCLGEYNCRGIIISKSDNNYTYTPYIMWSDGGQAGDITNIEKIEENIYKLTIHYKGYNNELGSAPEQTIENRINISEISSQALYIGDTQYQKITGDRETFFKSIMN